MKWAGDFIEQAPDWVKLTIIGVIIVATTALEILWPAL